MAPFRPLVSLPHDRPPRVAIFLSGSGSNALRLLERWSQDPHPPLEIVALVTDRPDSSRASQLGQQFGLPVIGHDIRAFYFSRGCRRITIATEEGRRLRHEWTAELRERLAPYEISFGLFAGFVPLTNLTSWLPCLNVHPGDLTYLKEGARYLVGLHTIPIERAILEGLDYLRTSVILAESYSGQGDDMDSGPILGVSARVPIDRQGHSLDHLREIAAERPRNRPPAGYGDLLETVAIHNQELLKVDGDWTVFPAVAWDVAAGRFALRDDQLLYRVGDDWLPVRTVVYDGQAAEPMPC